MISNAILCSFRAQLMKNQLRGSSYMRQMLITNKNSMVSFKRLINTSDKKKGHDNTGAIPSYVPGLMDPQPKGPETVKEFADVGSQKNWITYGWDIGNMENDRQINRWAFFIMVTLCTVIMPYIIAYYPDYKLTDWSVREAYIQLERRERLGLPLIDKNVVDPKLLELPSEEELEGIDIYI